MTRIHDIGGIAVWRLGGEEPGQLVGGAAKFGDASPPSPDATAPSVSITSPTDGAWLARKQPVDAQATDDVRVSRVEFYANGSLFAADTSSPFSVTWNTQRANKGANLIQRLPTIRAEIPPVRGSPSTHAADRASVGARNL